MVVIDSFAIGSGWKVHSMILKIVLRHIESIFLYETMLANVIYSKESKKGLNVIKSCTVLSIVNNAKYQTRDVTI
jgi:hypothetical protein